MSSIACVPSELCALVLLASVIGTAGVLAGHVELPDRTRGALADFNAVEGGCAHWPRGKSSSALRQFALETACQFLKQSNEGRERKLIELIPRDFHQVDTEAFIRAKRHLSAAKAFAAPTFVV